MFLFNAYINQEDGDSLKSKLFRPLKMPLNIHMIVNDPDNQNMVGFQKINNQVSALMMNSDWGREVVSFPAKFRIIGEALKALFQCFQIFVRLIDAPFFNGVKPYLFEISPCFRV